MALARARTEIKTVGVTLELSNAEAQLIKLVVGRTSIEGDEGFNIYNQLSTLVLPQVFEYVGTNVVKKPEFNSRQSRQIKGDINGESIQETD